MAKKIYDIMPPKVASKKSEAMKAAVGAGPKTRRQPAKRGVPKKAASAATFIPAISPREPRKFPLAEIIIGGGIICLLLGIYLYNKLPKAEIIISPALETVNFQNTITANKSTYSVDLAQKAIPAQYITESATATQEFPATGSASNDGKATGTIRVYNKVSPATPLSLKVGTHFLSDSGKYFVTLAKITIPAMQGKTAGSIAVTVQAEESGTAYNIGPAKFSVPKLSGTAYYYGIWAESTTAMAGGYTGKVKKVTKDDLETAKEVLSQKVSDDAQAALKAKVSDGQILLEGAIVSDAVETSANVKEGAVGDTFQQTAKVKMSAMVVKKQDLENLVKEYVASQLGQGKEYLDSKLDIQYTVSAVDAAKGTATIGFKVAAQTYDAIDSMGLVELVSQKSEAQIQETVSMNYGASVSKTEVNFWPFWVKKAPSNQDRIKVQLKFE